MPTQQELYEFDRARHQVFMQHQQQADGYSEMEQGTMKSVQKRSPSSASSAGSQQAQTQNGVNNHNQGGVNCASTTCPATTKWLKTNYEKQEGVSLPRCVMYSHYIEYCQEQDLEPMNPASFGKIIRMVFPNVKTRRLGNRGQSKYHYYGIGIRAKSQYRDSAISAQRISNVSGNSDLTRTKTMAQSAEPAVSNSSEEIEKVQSNFLADFPTLDNIRLTDDIKEKVGVFLVMYKHHCQRLLDTVLRANFSEYERKQLQKTYKHCYSACQSLDLSDLGSDILQQMVKENVVHFWSTLPSHVAGIMKNKSMISLVALCDAITYRTISRLLIPSALQQVPSSLIQAVRNFCKNLIGWVESALHKQPSKLKEKKIKLARAFVQNLFRQTEISHMASVARSVLHNSESMKRMQTDWQKLDKLSIARQCEWILADEKGAVELVLKYLKDFQLMMGRQTTIDRYMDWTKCLVFKFITKVCEETSADFDLVAREFLLRWNSITNVIIKELTLRSAETFGSYHLLSLLFKDYVTHYIAKQQQSFTETCLQEAVLLDTTRMEKMEVDSEESVTPISTLRSTVLASPQVSDGSARNTPLDQTVPDYYQPRESVMSSSLPSISEAFFNSSYNANNSENFTPPNNKQNWMYAEDKGQQYYTGYEQYNETSVPDCKYHCTNEGSVSLTVL